MEFSRFAHVASQTAWIEGDFEKGYANGALDAGGYRRRRDCMVEEKPYRGACLVRPLRVAGGAILYFSGRAMKITVEVNPEDLAAMTEQVMRAAGPEAVSKIWMAIGEQIAAQMHAQMLSQMPDAFRPFFDMRAKPAPREKT